VTTSALSVQKSARGSRTVLAGMGANPTRAVTIDALGTLLELVPPAPRLRAGLRERFGLEVSEAEAGRAMRAEIGFYRAHLHLGRDQAGLDALRRRCAEVLRDTLDAPALDLGALTEVLLAAIRFEPFPDTVPALLELRAAGVRIVAASNWDVSLHEQLERTGLRALLDGAVSSAEAGAAKPDPAILVRALELAGAEPAQAWHVGDDIEADVGAARAAGVRPVLIDREGGAAALDGVLRIASLAELPALCA
jgi:putative hydrolase of the HAD superfamily